jgi:hypothetical protein
MTSIMDVVEREFVGDRPPRFSDNMRVYPWEIGWCDLDRDPRYWDDRFGIHRTYIFRNGSIVIVRAYDHSKVVLRKLGSGQDAL